MTKRDNGNRVGIDELVAILDEGERAAWQAIEGEIGSNVYPRVAELLARVRDRLAGFDDATAGQLVGELRRREAARRPPPAVPVFADLAVAMPYPLGLKLLEVQRAQRLRDEGTPDPQEPFLVAATMGVLVRMAALLAIRAYVDAGGKDAALNQSIVKGLRAPADGTWLALAQELAEYLSTRAAPESWGVRVHTALKSKPPLPDEVARAAKGTTTSAALQALVAFRNKLAHGEAPTAVLLAQARAHLEVAARGFGFLTEHQLLVRFAGTVFALEGSAPRIVDDRDDLPEAEPCLVARTGEGAVTSLSPLLRFSPGEGAGDVDVDFDELFFVNAGSLERLGYIGYRAAGTRDGKSLGSYDEFKAFLAKIPTPPIPIDPRIDFGDLAAFHARLFTGRDAVLGEIHAAVRARTSQYVVLKALAGMGKSAILATLLQATRNHVLPESERIACAADALVRPGDRYAFHFCMGTDGRNSPTVALRSLIAQICDAFSLKRDDWLSTSIEDLKDKMFPALVARASSLLNGDERLVIVVDALDEGMGAEDETIPGCIPGGDYPGVVFLLSYRVGADGMNGRVEQQLVRIAAERRPILASANPLAGLTRVDVDAFLAKLDETTKASDATRAAVWEAASRDAPDDAKAADPFFLRFVADGVQQGAIRLDRAETVPTSLDDAFEEMWMGLPADREFLCHRMLLTLGILREFGSDALFAELFNRERPQDRLVPDDIAAVRGKVGKLLVYDGDKYGLFHDRFRRFLVGEQKDPIAEALENR